MAIPHRCELFARGGSIAGRGPDGALNEAEQRLVSAFAMVMTGISDPIEPQGGAESVDLLIDGATVITVDADRHVIRNGAVAVTGDRIRAVGKADDILRRFRARRRYDGSGKCVVPGFVNSHIHLYHAIHKNFVPEHMGGVVWSDFVHRHIARAVTPDDEISSGLTVLLETLRSGVTSFLEAGSYHVDAVMEPISALGMRGFIGRRSFDLVAQGHDMLRETTARCLSESERLLREYSDGRNRVRPCVVVVGNGRCSDALLTGAKRLADRYGTVLHMHHASMIENLHESWDRSGCRPTEHLAKLGVLDSNTVLVHVLQVDQNDIGLLAKSRCNVVHCPTTAMKINYGLRTFGRFVDMHKAGVNVALGTDAFDCSNDMTRLMYLTALVAKDVTYDPSASTAEQILEAATINGARALGLGAEIGSIETGKKADLAIFDMRRPEWAPVHNEIQCLVYCASAASCESVLIGGQFVLEYGRVTTVDEDEVYSRIRYQAERLAERTGLQARSSWPVS